MSQNVPFGLDAATQRRAVSALQDLLFVVIDLTLTLKHAHWNIRGTGFREMHLHLDEIVDVTRAFSDEVAERIVALALPADGRISAVAEGSRLDPFPSGFVSVDAAGDLLVGALDRVIAHARSAQAVLAEVDAVSEDLVIGGLREIEKHRWMLAAGSFEAT